MTGRRHPRLFAAALVATACAGCSREAPETWLINESPSVPRGVYRVSHESPSVGVLVALTPPNPGRRYLADLGAPAGARLLKRVAADGGDAVCRRGERLIWPRGAVIALTRDRRGRSLPQWRGCRPLRDDEILVLGDSLNSFDSRYFGPVRRDAVDGAYREVWRW